MGPNPKDPARRVEIAFIEKRVSQRLIAESMGRISPESLDSKYCRITLGREGGDRPGLGENRSFPWIQDTQAVIA